MDFQDFIGYCKEKGFIFPSSEIYGGFSGFFDWGHNGTLMKRNIQESYIRNFVGNNPNIIIQDSSIITHPDVWKASGHAENFSDPVFITTTHRVRADHFIEDKLGIRTDGMSAESLLSLARERGLLCEGEPIIGVESKNLMLHTRVGVENGSGTQAYLRPETCQAIFLNAKYLANINRLQLPFGICQIGKAFRNEISPRNFTFRCREFEQMELEYFFDPQTTVASDPNLGFEISCLLSEEAEEKVVKLEDLKSRANTQHLYWIGQFLQWLTGPLGIKKENLRLREHHKDELSHYSSATFDIDYRYPFPGWGFKELCGIANRTDFDMKQHSKWSKKSLTMKSDSGQDIFPHVIEPSIGLDRLFMAILCDSYEWSTEREYVVLHLAPELAPIDYAVFPLYGKGHLKEDYDANVETVRDKLVGKGKRVFVDKSGSIGKRYARQDEIGTPFCVTVDSQTVEDGTVTVRNRDTKAQTRVSISLL